MSEIIEQLEDKIDDLEGKNGQLKKDVEKGAYLLAEGRQVVLELEVENERLRLLLEEVAKVPEEYVEFIKKNIEKADVSKVNYACGWIEQVGDAIAFKLHPRPMTQKEADTK
jgi:regulator of replication initiation timing